MPDIKKKIKELGFTTQQIAAKLNISQQAVSQAVNGNPSLSRLGEIAAAMGITVSELVADDVKDANGESVIRYEQGGQKMKISVKIEPDAD